MKASWISGAVAVLVTGSAAAQQQPASAAAVIEQYGLEQAATPVSERPGWRKPQRILVGSAFAEVVDELRPVAPGVEFIVARPGEEAKQAVDDFSSTLESESEDIEETIDGISGISDLPSAAQDASASLSSVYAALSTMLASIRTGDAQDELETAFENAEACDDLGD